MAVTATKPALDTRSRDAGKPAPDTEPESARFPLPWVVAGAAVPMLLTLWDVQAQHHDFDAGFGRGLAAVAFAGLLGALLVLTVHELNPDERALGTGVALAAVLTVSFLNQSRFLWESPSLLFGGLAVAAMAVAGRWARLHGDDPRALVPPPRTAPVLATAVALLAGLIAGFGPVDETLGAQLAELLRYLLLGLGAVVLLAGDPAGNDGEVTLDEQFRRSVLAATTPIGLLFVTWEPGSAAILAAGVVAMLAARRFWFSAGLTAVVAVAVGTVWCWLAAGKADKAWRDSHLEKRAEPVWDSRIWESASLGKHRSWVDQELPAATLVGQYGHFFAVLGCLLVAAFGWLLVRLVLAARPSSVQVLAAGLVAMLVAGLALPLVALLTNHRFGLTVPLLSSGVTSLILALASVGVALGAAAGPRVSGVGGRR
ncbi:hypothetical protein Franean1_5235 [Parafrankia sp. EAN1pec]|nr:hypothetical protein Franean1_5235 [Frankia sp. EAN1pec]